MPCAYTIGAMGDDMGVMDGGMVCDAVAWARLYSDLEDMGVLEPGEAAERIRRLVFAGLDDA